MKTIKIDDKEYHFEIASDVIRDGIGVELSEIINGKEIYLAEIFRNDNKKKIEFTANNNKIPLQVIDKLIDIFKTEIPQEYQD